MKYYNFLPPPAPRKKERKMIENEMVLALIESNILILRALASLNKMYAPVFIHPNVEKDILKQIEKLKEMMLWSAKAKGAIG
jgi:hypothetical protein